MFKKTRIRRILEYQQSGMSARMIAQMLHVSRNTINEALTKLDSSGQTLETALAMDDEALYAWFYPEKFRTKENFAEVDYGYIHVELKRQGVTLKLLWEEYVANCRKDNQPYYSYSTFTRNYSTYVHRSNYTSAIRHRPGETVEVDWAGKKMSYTDRDSGQVIPVYLFVATLPYSQYVYVEATEHMEETDWLSCHVNLFRFLGRTPIKVVCDNVKTAVLSHPRHGVAVLNENYLSLAEHYSVAIVPAGVRKPKQKASVEGSVGKITTHIIARLRDEAFYSLRGINEAIQKLVREFNEKPFQKRAGSRKIVFEAEEKPCMKELPLLPYEVCEWSYRCKVGPDSHIWLFRCRYSVPYRFIGKYVDVKYTAHQVYVYHNQKEIARHERYPKSTRNEIRTDESHLPLPLKRSETVETLLETAQGIGPNAYRVVSDMFETAKVKNQPAMDVGALIALKKAYSKDTLEHACEKALEAHEHPNYKDVRELMPKKPRNRVEKAVKASQGIVRGPEYYNGGKQ